MAESTEPNQTSSNVILIEPNDVNTEGNNNINAIPQYQDMYIFAELIAESKGRTVIIDGNTSSTSSGPINFIGNDQNEKDNPNYLNFTTNYYDGSNKDGEYYEGFGISNIKILTNSSFIPQVDIQFIDIRGLAFFNQNNSPYRILFDFPPPIFHLTVKGYYGKPLTYKLHLVSYTSEFSSANGNFTIDAKFVAVTFAPLADILFRYVVNAPLINNRESLNPNPAERPKNTYELIMKLKTLYKAVGDALKSDVENQQYDTILTTLENVDEIGDMLKSIIKKENEVLNVAGEEVLLMIKSPKEDDYSGINPAIRASEDYNLTVAKTLTQYNTLIQGEETSGNIVTPRNRLIIGYQIGTDLPLMSDDFDPFSKYSVDNAFQAPWANPSTKNYDTFSTPLVAYRESLRSKNSPKFNIIDTDIPDPEPFTNNTNIKNQTQVKTEYYAMDITDFYYKIYKSGAKLNKQKDELAVTMSEKINNLVFKNLGMTPSIYNIFDIILGDVDKLFEKMRDVSEMAETEHNESPSNEIIYGNTKGIDTKILGGDKIPHLYPYPLIVETQQVYGGTKQERKAPIELSQNTHFPELDLVTDFIDTFLLQNKLADQYNARENQNEEGVFDWIPFSPLDSKLGGASPISPYLNVNNNVFDASMVTFLKRVYMLAQGTLSDSFYRKTDRTPADDAYVKLYANAEAVNLVSTVTTDSSAKNMQIFATKFKSNIDNDADGFYTYASGLTDTYDNGSGGVVPNGKLFTFPTEKPAYFPVSPNTISGKMYVNKQNPEFIGFLMHPAELRPQIEDTAGKKKDGTNEESGSSSNPVVNFSQDAKSNWLKNGVFGASAAESFYGFTMENVIFIGDNNNGVNQNKNPIIEGTPTFTRYLYDINTDGKWVHAGGSGRGNYKANSKFPDDYNDAINNGNKAFKEEWVWRDKVALNKGRNLMDFWGEQFWGLPPVTMNILTGTSQQNQRLASVILLSNFGTTVSPFNTYPNYLNSIVFDTPAAIEVPYFYNLYLGALLDSIENEWDDTIVDFFTNPIYNNSWGYDNDAKLDDVTGNYVIPFPCEGYLVLADLHDVDLYISKKDKEQLIVDYDNYLNGTGINIRERIVSMNTQIRINGGFYGKYDDRNLFGTSNPYTFYMNKRGGGIKNIGGKDDYKDLPLTMLDRTNLINFSQITFKMDDTYDSTYTSFTDLNTDPIYKNIHQTFFSTFFRKLDSELAARDKKIIEEEKALKKAKGDEDIITQLYYSFKNINDKWLTGSQQKLRNYPYNENRANLINSFAFVDRAMNPIGDTMINAEILVEMLDDPNLSLFTVLTQLLSLNGFEFFPLQNFMSFANEDSWKDSFKIHTGKLNDNNSPFFVCMYIGGSASYPSISGNGFENDGIINISKPGVADYSIPKITEEKLNELRTRDYNSLTEDEKQLLNQDFPWQDVRAFKVRFGEQNQSMFTEMKIDSKEYPETNESIQILSRLAGDNSPDAPVPKGQNLYNLYENRSYKATINGFGNMMIQPTQYFQLENVPLFNGAYIILSVEHNITPNKMTTSFSGTKLLKYPLPRVMNPIAFTSFRGLSVGGATAAAAQMQLDSSLNVRYDSMHVGTENTLRIR